MNKILSILVVGVIVAVVYLLSNDVAKLEQAQKDNIKDNHDVTLLSDVTNPPVIASKPKPSIQTDAVPSTIENKIVENTDSDCTKDSSCEKTLAQQIRYAYELTDYEFPKSVYDDLAFIEFEKNLFELSGETSRISRYLKIDEVGGRDILVLETKGYPGADFLKQYNSANPDNELNKDYFIFYGDEVNVSFKASNEFQNAVNYKITSKMYDQIFEFGESKSINEMPMCKNKSIEFKLLQRNIIPIVPECDGPLEKQNNAVKITDSALIRCVYPESFNENEAFIVPEKVLYLRCISDGFGKIEEIVELKNLSAINVDNEMLSSSIIQQAPSVKVVSIVGKVLDVGNLLNFAQLNSLNIVHNSVTNIEDLSKLGLLTSLTINFSPIQNYSFLSFLTNLKYLNLDSQKLEKMPDLSGNKEITELSVMNNALKNLDGIGHLTKLNHFVFRKNKVKDISDLDFDKGFKFVDGRLNPIDCTTFNGVRSESVQILCK